MWKQCGNKSHDFNLHSTDCFSSRIFATVKINDLHSIKLQVDIGADACMTTTTDLQHFPFFIPPYNLLNGYGDGRIGDYLCMFSECYIHEQDHSYQDQHGGGTMKTIHGRMQTV